MPGWRVFLIKPLPKVRRTLRVFSFSEDCTGGARSYHNAELVIEPERNKPLPNPDGFEEEPDESAYADDPRWPTTCPTCGKPFAGMKHERQVNDERLYEGAPDGKLYSLHQPELPVGALWDAWWIGRKGPDGLCLMLKCPGGEWWIDGTAANGPGWTRTGTVPVITVTPSIGIYGKAADALTRGFAFHSWLTNGVLLADIEGHHFPEHPFTAP